MKARLTQLKKIEGEWYQKITDFKSLKDLVDYLEPFSHEWNRFEITFFNENPSRE